MILNITNNFSQLTTCLLVPFMMASIGQKYLILISSNLWIFFPLKFVHLASFLNLFCLFIFGCVGSSLLCVYCAPARHNYSFVVVHRLLIAVICDVIENWDFDIAERRHTCKMDEVTQFWTWIESMWGFPGGTVVKNPPANAGDTGSSPGLGRSHMPRSN